MAFHKIILPVDGSAAAKRAAATAGELAATTKASVVVVHVRSRFGSVALLNVGTASFAVLLGLLVLTPLLKKLIGGREG